MEETTQDPVLFVDPEQAEENRARTISISERQKQSQEIDEASFKKRQFDGDSYLAPSTAISDWQKISNYDPTKGEYDPRADEPKTVIGALPAAEKNSNIPKFRKSNPFRSALDSEINKAYNQQASPNGFGIGILNKEEYGHYWSNPNEDTRYSRALNKAYNWEKAVTEQKSRAEEVRSKQSSPGLKQADLVPKNRGIGDNGDPKTGGDLRKADIILKKFHISPSGKVSECKATVRACPYGDVSHFVTPYHSFRDPNAVLEQANHYKQQQSKRSMDITGSRVRPGINPVQLIQEIADKEEEVGAIDEFKVTQFLAAPNEAQIKIERCIEAEEIGSYKSKAFWRLSPLHPHVGVVTSDDKKEGVYKYYDQLTDEGIKEFILANSSIGKAFSRVESKERNAWADEASASIRNYASVVEAEAELEPLANASHSVIEVEDSYIQRNEGVINVNANVSRDGFRSNQLATPEPGEQIGLFRLEDQMGEGSGEWSLSREGSSPEWVLSTRGSRGETIKTTIEDAQDVNQSLDNFYHQQLSIDLSMGMDEQYDTIEKSARESQEIKDVINVDKKLQLAKKKLDSEVLLQAQQMAHQSSFDQDTQGDDIQGDSSNSKEKNSSHRSFGRLFKMLQ
jgi:hypothetical protein